MSSLKKFSHLFRGFTLVELIVVISVLAVLATIAMSQVSNITSNARDSQRLTDITTMKGTLEIYAAQKGPLPTPSNSTQVTYSGGIVWTQGTFGESVVRALKSISPKPIDPKYNLEYVYSVANTGKEYELGGILEKTTGLLLPVFDEASAASAQNIAIVKGNYSGLSLKVVTGSTTYVLAIPTLIAGEIPNNALVTSTALVIDGKGSLPTGFSGSVVSTVQTGTFTPTLAWSGEKLPTTQTGIAQMVQQLQTAYSGTNASSLTQIQTLLTLTGTTNLANYGNGLLDGSLGGSAVALAPEAVATPTLAACTLPWGGTIESGQSVTAYSATGVTSPATCSSVAQTRTCTNGTLSGTSTNQACVTTNPADSVATNVVTLLHFDGNLNDESGKTWTPAGTAASSGAQSKFGGSSLYLNGDGNYISTPSSSDFSLVNDGDWTLDFQVFIPNIVGNMHIALNAPYGDTGTAGWSMRLGPATGNSAGINFLVGASANVITNGQITGGQWNHVALVNSAGTIRFYINGVQDSATFSSFPSASSSPLIIGKGVTYSAGHWLTYAGYDFKGYLDEFRITKGVARWTSSFTPPTTATRLPTSTGYVSSNPGTSCKTLYAAGIRDDGFYWIKPDATAAFKVYCDMTTDGGGWTKVFNLTLPATSCILSSSTVGNLAAPTGCDKLSDSLINTLATEKIFRSKVTDKSPLYSRYSGTISFSSYLSVGQIVNKETYAGVAAASLLTPAYGGFMGFAQHNWYQADTLLGSVATSCRLSLEYATSASSKYACCAADCSGGITTGNASVYIK